MSDISWDKGFSLEQNIIAFKGRQYNQNLYSISTKSSIKYFKYMCITYIRHERSKIKKKGTIIKKKKDGSVETGTIITQMLG